uniref:GP-PDE domain-containing protein n=1 Tax=Panagrellus redivivus TaxID=6233 RepID=A0A7E4ZUU8_PANRE
MALSSSSSTVHLPSLSFGVRRNFFDIMPLNVLNALREQSDTAKSMTKFRGEFINCLNVQTDAFKECPWYNYTLYSEVMNRQFNTTPVERLTVHMGPDVDPEALLTKMEKCYRDLYLIGDYDWKDVIAFLHAGVECVSLSGNMNLPVDNMEEFLQSLMWFKIKKVCFFNDNCKKFWLPTAFEYIHKQIGTTVKSVELTEGFYPKIQAVMTDSTVIEVVAPDFGYEYDVEMEDIEEGIDVNNDFEV